MLPHGHESHSPPPTYNMHTRRTCTHPPPAAAAAAAAEQEREQQRQQQQQQGLQQAAKRTLYRAVTTAAAAAATAAASAGGRGAVEPLSPPVVRQLSAAFPLLMTRVWTCEEALRAGGEGGSEAHVVGLHW